MDIWEHDGRLFEVTMVSDIVRDVMALELTDLGSSNGAPALEAVWQDDGSGSFDLIAHQLATLPLAIVERFMMEARNKLPR